MTCIQWAERNFSAFHIYAHAYKFKVLNLGSRRTLPQPQGMVMCTSSEYVLDYGLHVS